MSLTINTKKMLSFYEELEVINFKYRLPNAFNATLLRKIRGIMSSDTDYVQLIHHININQLTPDVAGEMIRDYLKNKLSEFEEVNNITKLTREDYGFISANIDFVYNDMKLTQDMLQLMSLMRDKVIGSYLSIEGIERLLNSKYIEFEWAMHLSANFSKHDMQYYRDHFFHQFRNAFAMHKLLCSSVTDIYKEVRKNLGNDATGKTAQFINYHIEKQKQQFKTPIEKVVDCVDEDFYLRNIIYMSSYMSALFHDIGYPVTYYLQLDKGLSEYMPYAHYFSGTNGNFSAIFSLLQNSLLFRVVNLQQIKSRLSFEKPEHGAISAILFLLHFYENGAIFKLPPYKIAAIELAALSIYNHTNKYEILGDKDELITYRPSFAKNPLSYLLRIVDDMQEWDRIYFEVSENTNILVCNKCFTALINTNPKGIDESKVYFTDRKAKFVCNCASESSEACYTVERAFDSVHGIRYRRFYNVSVCDEIKIEKDNNNTRIATFAYDLFKLLNMSLINHTYAQYRAKELNAMKHLLFNQQDFPKVVLEYFMSSNPILIKVMMIEKYVQCVGGFQFQDDVSLDKQSVDARGFLGEAFNFSVYCPQIVVKYMDFALDLYSKLFILKKGYENSVGSQLITAFKDNIIKVYGTTDDLQCLITDCFAQFERCADIMSGRKSGIMSPEYVKEYTNTTKYYTTAVHRFTNPALYKSREQMRKENREKDVDAFTDLYFFKKLADCIDEHARKP